MRKLRKRIIRITLVLAVLCILTALIGNWRVYNIAQGKTFTSADEIPFNKVGLVLGTSKFTRNGNINMYFEYRIRATIQLYKSGKIKYILVSGDNGNKNYDEPTAFKNELISRGILAEKIYLDYAGFRTLDSVIRAHAIFGQSSFTIISQKFHNERAIYLAEKKGLNVFGYNVEDVTTNAGMKTKVREFFARTKAFLDILFGVGPKFYGEKITIG